MSNKPQEYISSDAHIYLKNLTRKLNIKNVEVAEITGRTASSVTNYFKKNVFPKSLALHTLETLEVMMENKKKANMAKYRDRLYLIRDLKSEIEES